MRVLILAVIFMAGFVSCAVSDDVGGDNDGLYFKFGLSDRN